APRDIREAEEYQNGDTSKQLVSRYGTSRSRRRDDSTAMRLIGTLRRAGLPVGRVQYLEQPLRIELRIGHFREARQRHARVAAEYLREVGWRRIRGRRRFGSG